MALCFSKINVYGFADEEFDIPSDLNIPWYSGEN